MTTPTKRPSRRRPAAPPAEGHRPLRSVGYRVPVVLDDELDDDGATWTAAAPAHPPMWEQQWEEPPAAEPPAGVVPPPLPVVEIGPEVPALADDPDLDAEPDGPRSLYLAALRVRHLQPGVFQRVLLVEGVFALAVILALADLASPWLIAVLPAVVAVLVKLHDLVEEGIERARAGTQDGPGARSGAGVVQGPSDF